MRAHETAQTDDADQARIVLRKASDDDVPQLIRLHRVAMRELGRTAYTVDQIDAFLLSVPTVDTALIDDRTYFVAEVDGRIVGAGGWTVHAPDYAHAIDFGGLGAAGERAAMIRAMYTDPDWARRGIGRRILDAAEAEARVAGFRRIELHALLPGVPLYRAAGYRTVAHRQARLADGVTLPVVHMDKITATRPADAPPDRLDGGGGPPYRAAA